MSQYKNEMLEKDMQEAKDHGVRTWCKTHRSSFEDTCQWCDQETPFDRKAYWREFQCIVKVRNIAWLTLAGMTPEEGWDGLQKFLRDEYKSLAWNLQKRDIVLDYDIWTGEPEEA